MTLGLRGVSGVGVWGLGLRRGFRGGRSLGLKRTERDRPSLSLEEMGTLNSINSSGSYIGGV